MHRSVISVLLGPIVAAGAISAAQAQLAIDTGFTYQGRLTDGGSAPTGLYDIQFTIWDAPTLGSQGGVVLADDVQVSSGLFTARLDFGTVFSTQKRWIQLAVRPGVSTGAYTTLLPRQEVTSVPWSNYSLAPWETISGLGIKYNTGYNVSVGTSPTLADRLLVQCDPSNGNAIHGISLSSAFNGAGVFGEGNGGNTPTGVLGVSNVTNGTGVTGRGNAVGGYFAASSTSGTSVGVFAYGIQNGLVAGSDAGVAVSAGASSGIGVEGISSSGWGVHGISNSQNAVQGDNTTSGCIGALATTSFGVYGRSITNSKWGGQFENVANGCTAVLAGTNEAVYGFSNTATRFGGQFINTAPGGVALYANGLAQVKVLQILGGSDLAEPFDVSKTESQPDIQPGMVVVIDPDHPGDLKISTEPYDTKAAGILSGANGLAPGLVMSAKGQEHADGARPVAMSGRVWCWVDASFGEVKPGDCLTTSSTAGMAMRSSEASRVSGACIGKAMTGLKDDRGLVLVLVNLH